MKKIPLIKPAINANKLKKAIDKMSKSGILTKGEFVEKFQQQLKDFLKVKYVFATTSATTALHLALVAGGITAGNEVLVSDFSFPASGNAIVQKGAKPVFVDINLDDFCLDASDLKKKITPKSKAIMVVHAFGYPANMTEIMKIAKQHHLLVIEDAACAIGSKHREKFCGTWGNAGCFSFHPRKVITTGEGGAIVTNNKKMAQKIEILRNHGGIMGQNGMEFLENGFNYRLSELQAALGVAQMDEINKIIKKRQILAIKFLGKLKEMTKNLPAGRQVRIINEKQTKNFNFQSFVILLDRDVNRNQVIKAMAQKGIETTLGTYSMHAQLSFRRFGYKPGDLPNSYLAYQQTLTLPLYDGLTYQEMDFIAENLRKVLAK